MNQKSVLNHTMCYFIPYLLNPYYLSIDIIVENLNLSSKYKMKWRIFSMSNIEDDEYLYGNIVKMWIASFWSFERNWSLKKFFNERKKCFMIYLQFHRDIWKFNFHIKSTNKNKKIIAEAPASMQIMFFSQTSWFLINRTWNLLMNCTKWRKIIDDSTLDIITMNTKCYSINSRPENIQRLNNDYIQSIVIEEIYLNHFPSLHFWWKWCIKTKILQRSGTLMWEIIISTI